MVVGWGFIGGGGVLGMVISYTTVATLLESNAARQKQRYALISTRNPLKLFDYTRKFKIRSFR
jgi:hypothetical protein